MLCEAVLLLFADFAIPKMIIYIRPYALDS